MHVIRRRSAFLSQMQYRFVDCRWSLDDPGAGRRAYLEGHIPGATFLDVEQDLSSTPGPGGRHPLPSRSGFAAAAGRTGIGPGTFVVAYGTLGGAERLWWLLRHFGHDECAVLELEGWRGPLRAGEEIVEPVEFTPAERTDDTVERYELERRLGELVVIDARVPSRWRGEANAVDRVPGRIPGSVNVPWNDEGAPLPEGELVAYCGSGVTACVTLHRLHLAGRSGRLYPGSWSEWEQDPALPVERSGPAEA
jgi:thiosulfate/3-mercaptopyruvate sulfurtransferase